MINIAIEGESDREAAKAVVIAAGRTIGRVAAAGGKTRLDPKIPKYNDAAKRANWVVFRDSDGECPVQLRTQLLSTLTSAQSSRFSLRIAHSMTEAWLMADPARFAEFFHVRVGKIPTSVEGPTARQADTPGPMRQIAARDPRWCGHPGREDRARIRRAYQPVRIVPMGCIGGGNDVPEPAPRDRGDTHSPAGLRATHSLPAA